MMMVQSDRYTKRVFQFRFLVSVFGFGFFQEPPQPTGSDFSTDIEKHRKQ